MKPRQECVVDDKEVLQGLKPVLFWRLIVGAKAPTP